MCHKCGYENKCCKERTCAPTPISKPTTIKKSGCYCLTRDICGPIIIAHKNVELDLNCHQVHGKGEQAAISATDVNNVTIKNGSVVSTLPGNGVVLTNVKGFVLDDLAVSDCNRGLWIQDSSIGKVTCCRFYDNTNSDVDEGSAVVSVINSSCIDFEDVEVCGNTKQLVEFDGREDRDGIVTVVRSNGVNFENCKSSNNFLANDNSNMALYMIAFSSDCLVRNCQANENKTPLDETTFGSAVFGIHLLVSNNCVVEHFQACKNKMGVAIFFFGMRLFDSNNCLVSH
ncbi:unnamed protein product, partial [marine sediment metagenome]